jgi:GNAT superfamily N-acetyltransferase
MPSYFNTNNMKGIVIAPYIPANKESVGELIVTIQRDEFGIPITLEKQPDLLDIPGFYQVNNGNFWVAEMDDQIVGTISLLDIGNKQGALRKMFVDKNHRGATFGVGQKLLDVLFQWGKEKRFEEILLGTTEKFLAAHRFYEKNGFSEIRKENLPPAFPVMSVDVKFYSKKV